MANVGTAAAGKTLIGAGNGRSPTYADIGTNSGLTAHGIVIAEGNSAFTVAIPGTSGFVLTSNGASSDPTFQSVSATGAATTITGNTGGALSPTGGNWNIVGSHGINTSGSGSTLTVAINNAITLGDLAVLGAGVGALTATTGDVIISAGNLNLPTTSSANAGVVEVNNVRFMHSFGTSNTFLGASSGNFTLSGQASVGIGTNSLTALTSGLRNTAIGNASLFTLTTADDNTAVGNEALKATNDNYNTAVGSFALNKYTGGGNTAVGQNALGNVITGDHNVAVGYASLAVGTNVSNTGIGYQALTVLTTGARNTSLGDASGFNILTGSDNIFIGKNSALSYTGAESSNIIIGAAGTLGESNKIRIGTQGSGAAQQNACYIAGIAGVNPSNPTLTVIDSSSGNLGNIAATNRAALATTSAGVPQWLAMTDGQLIIGSTAGAPAAAALTAGTGISITNASNSITISASSSGFSWTDVTGATQTIVAENGYITDRGGGVTYTLPASASLGDTFKIIGKLGLTTITPLALQQLLIGSASGTVGITGTAVSTNVGDCITFVCITPGTSTVWRAHPFEGNWILN